MSKFTFKEFQAEYPDDAACLAKLMEVNYGGTEITCPDCGVEKAQFHAMNTRKAFACQGVRPPHLPLRRDYLSQEQDAADQVVFCNVPADLNPLRGGRQRARAGLGRHLQVRMADGA